MNAGLIVLILLVICAFLGLPIYLSVAVGTMVAMASAGFPLEAVAQKTFLGLNSASLLSIPFFILAGNLMLPRCSVPSPVPQWPPWLPSAA